MINDDVNEINIEDDLKKIPDYIKTKFSLMSDELIRLRREVEFFEEKRINDEIERLALEKGFLTPLKHVQSNFSIHDEQTIIPVSSQVNDSVYMNQILEDGSFDIMKSFCDSPNGLINSTPIKFSPKYNSPYSNLFSTPQKSIKDNNLKKKSYSLTNTPIKLSPKKNYQKNFKVNNDSLEINSKRISIQNENIVKSPLKSETLEQIKLPTLSHLDVLHIFFSIILILIALILILIEIYASFFEHKIYYPS